MRGRPAAVALVALGCVAALLGTTPASAAPSGAVLDRQDATLTAAHRDETSTTLEPGRRIAQAVVSVEIDPDGEDRLRATVDLEAPAPRNSDSELLVGLGHLGPTGCKVLVGDVMPTRDQQQRYQVSVGVDAPHDLSKTGTPEGPFDCTAVLTRSLDGSQFHDVLTTGLTNSYVAPALKVRQVRLLGAKQQKLRLVRGAWTPYTVTVRNTGNGPAGALRITGKGKGVKVRRATSAAGLEPGDTREVDVWVKLVGRVKKSRLTLRVEAGGGVRATRRLVALRVKAPKRAVNGSYRSKDGAVRFRVVKGKVKGFRVTTRQRCGTAPDTSVTGVRLGFPTTRIPAHGLVKASQEGSSANNAWVARLQLRAAGRKVTKGLFEYSMHVPGVVGSHCRAAESFTAKRVGR